MTRAFINGLSTGHPTVAFQIGVPKGAAALRGVTVVLPRGLIFVRHRVGKRLVITGVHVSGARGVSLSISHGHLVIRLGKATAGFTVRIGSQALAESAALKAKAKAHKLRTLVLSLVAANTAGTQTTVRVRFNHFGR